MEATPISGPAWMYTPPSDSRAIVDPTTLQIPRTRAPFRLASRIAASVSAVSPDWLIAMTSVPGGRIGFR